ncbi:hypothetical protein QBC33DRAFT_123457 [Phialemonium atrogriseum]|uniref:FAD-binding PCMH-type domain-containing protein n=1 Tax=Phialemonium atrogriseum TaxID=1093897 RepID=A0AAJ0BZJ5_9PEZI|nr:uncharacterized protein QBC33DRAFT_123457 [Phialemonium atrogriseum]KAK1766009.1 hypothetical protein QBC33DRAFT_123457 [Phialemonium atrogriseum]
MYRYVMLSLLIVITGTLVVGAVGSCPICRSLPGDAGWPTVADWDNLNHTVGGRLIATIPEASVCHTEPYHNHNATACAALKPLWDFPQAHFAPPAEFGSGWFQNGSCDPFTPALKLCELGNYVSYAINVTGVDDVVAGISFSKKKNIRLVIKNTGHDVLGKSTGKGGLSLWTFNMKSTEIIPSYSSSYYKGPAIKLGAGTMAEEAYVVADSAGYRLVGGSCPTVGISGGYSQGGGHSPLSGIYGLSADNVLEWEVVTANGDHLVATPKKNADLYWALSGGGGGSFGVVLSMTTRLYADGEVGGAVLAFNDTSVGNAAFWDAVSAFHAALPPILAGGTTISYGMTYHSFTTYSVTAPSSSEGEVADVFSSFLADLDQRGMPYTFSTHTSPTYLTHFARDFGPLPYGTFTVSQLVTSRLIPRSVVLDPARNDAVTQILRNATASGDNYVLCQSLDVDNSTQAQARGVRTRPVAHNAVLPAWRDAASHCLIIAAWDWTVPRSVMAEREAVLVGKITPALEAATPGSGTYLNEANFAQVGWQAQFYGANYPRLLRVKAEHDPDGVFYAATAVGSEAWVADGSGRLCRAAA